METTTTASSSKYSMNIEAEMIKCLDTGSTVAPDPSAFKSFACCNNGEAGEKADFLLFVVTAESSGDKGGVDMLWLSNESSTGYNKKGLIDRADGRFANQRVVHINASNGHDGKPVLVAIAAPSTWEPTEEGADPKPEKFTVWTCGQLLASIDDGMPEWTPCGWFQAAEIMGTSVTTTATGDNLVVVNAEGRIGRSKVFYGTSATNDPTTKMEKFPLTSDMAEAREVTEVYLTHDGSPEKDENVSAISLVMGSEVGEGILPQETKPVLSIQSLPDPEVYHGDVSVPADAICFASIQGPHGPDLFVGGKKKAMWYGLKGWRSGSSPHTKNRINDVDFEAPAKDIRARVDGDGTKHVWILLENGDLMYTFESIDDDDDEFLEPVTIVPNTKEFDCHVDSATGHVHLFTANDNGHVVHNVKDEGTSLWMKKEILVPGGAAKNHMMSVVEITVTDLGQVRGPFVPKQPDLPPVSISCASAAMIRVNGKGHLMCSDTVIEEPINAAGVVRISQFVDSFAIPRIMIHMPGMHRPIEVLSSKILHNKLKDADGDTLREAKLPDVMGNEGVSLIADPDVAHYADGVMDSIKGLIEVFEEFQHMDFVGENDSSGDVKLAGGALGGDKQLVVWGGNIDDDEPSPVDTAPLEATPHSLPDLESDEISEEGHTSRKKGLKLRRRWRKETKRTRQRFNKMKVSGKGPLKTDLRRFSLKASRSPTTSRVQADLAESSASTKKAIVIRHPDIGNIAKKAKETAEMADLQAKNKAVKQLQVESDAATEASALAEMRAKEFSATVLEAKELVRELKEQERQETSQGFTSRSLKLRGFKKKLKDVANDVVGAGQSATNHAANAVNNAQNAGNNVATGLVEASKDAVEKAKETVEHAYKETSQAANDFADTIEDTYHDIADDVRKEFGNIKGDTVGVVNKIGNAVVDGVEVVESVTMEVVEVVEEVIEVAKDEAGKAIRVVQAVPKKSIRVIVEMAGIVYEFLADAVEQVLDTLSWVWGKIKVGIQKALEWLADFFHVGEIIKTAQLLEDLVVCGLERIIDTIPTADNIRQAVDAIRSKIKDSTGLDLESQTAPEGVSKPQASPKVSWVTQHAMNGSFHEPDELDEASEAEVDDFEVDEDPQTETSMRSVESAMERLKNGASINDVFSTLIDAILNIVEAAAILRLTGVSRGLEAFKDWIARGGRVYIPLISELFELATGEDLKLGKAMFLMVAIPTTYTFKLATRKWPSQSIDMSALRRKKTIATQVSLPEGGHSDGEGDDGKTHSVSLGGSEDNNDDEGTPDEILLLRITAITADSLAICLKACDAGKKNMIPFCLALANTYVSLSINLNAKELERNAFKAVTNVVSTSRVLSAAQIALYQTAILVTRQPSKTFKPVLLPAQIRHGGLFFATGILRLIEGIAYDENKKLVQGGQITLTGLGILLMTCFDDPAKDFRMFYASLAIKLGANGWGMANALVDGGYYV